MLLDWTLAQKPWPMEVCKERFVKGNKLTYEQLAEEAGRKLGWIQKKAAADKWQQARKTYQETLAESVYETAVNITPHWTQAEKPWPRNTVALRYMQGEKITLRRLAYISGHSYDTVQNWSVEDNYAKERRRLQDQLRTATQDAYVEMEAHELAKITAKVNENHRKVFLTQRQLASAFINHLSILVNGIKIGTKEDDKELIKSATICDRIASFCGPNALGTCAKILTDACNYERALWNLDIVDPKVLEDEALKQGLLLIHVEELEAVGIEV